MRMTTAYIGNTLAAFYATAAELLDSTDTLLPGEIARGSGETGSDGFASDQGSAMMTWLSSGDGRLLESLRKTANEIVMGYSAFVIGCPHQELVPWCGWLRPVQARHADWLNAWPDMDELHP